jgi:hypothetical protein
MEYENGVNKVVDPDCFLCFDKVKAGDNQFEVLMHSCDKTQEVSYTR